MNKLTPINCIGFAETTTVIDLEKPSQDTRQLCIKRQLSLGWTEPIFTAHRGSFNNTITEEKLIGYIDPEIYICALNYYLNYYIDALRTETTIEELPFSVNISVESTDRYTLPVYVHRTIKDSKTTLDCRTCIKYESQNETCLLLNTKQRCIQGDNYLTTNIKQLWSYTK
jgi:hypothetical protein